MMRLDFEYHVYVLGIYFAGIAFWAARGVEAIKLLPRSNQAVE